MFKNAPNEKEFRGWDGNYFTIHYTFRALVGGDPLSRKIFLESTHKEDIMAVAGYKILNDIGVVFDWSDKKV
jgi:hypothetical protein